MNEKIQKARQELEKIQENDYHKKMIGKAPIFVVCFQCKVRKPCYLAGKALSDAENEFFNGKVVESTKGPTMG